MRNKLGFFVSLMLITSQIITGAVYYVDATNGNDSNDGLSEITAWRTINKVNNSSFTPGDFILFKRGEIWREQLSIPSSGTSGNLIIFGDYGSGDLPIIFGSNKLTNWTQQGLEDIWYTNDLSTDPIVIWLDGLSYFEATDAESVDSENRWYWDSANTRLFVYATSNPTLFYNT